MVGDYQADDTGLNLECFAFGKPHLQSPKSLPTKSTWYVPHGLPAPAGATAPPPPSLLNSDGNGNWVSLFATADFADAGLGDIAGGSLFFFLPGEVERSSGVGVSFGLLAAGRDI